MAAGRGRYATTESASTNPYRLHRLCRNEWTSAAATESRIGNAFAFTNARWTDLGEIGQTGCGVLTALNCFEQ